MKILCSHSGIEFTCEHFPGTLYSRETSHPIFQIPQKRLLGYLGKWSSNGLTPTDSYLLFLALLNSTDRVDFRVPAAHNNRTDILVAQNMEFLARTVIKINTIVNITAVFPKFVISTDTHHLENIAHWIQAWHDSYEEFKSGKIKDWDDRKLIQREHALERMIKSPHKSVSSYSGQISDWAATAGEFPTWQTQNPFNGFQPISCSDYWKLLIEKCTKEDGTIFTIPRVDLKDLLEHCEQHIEYGTIFSKLLFKVIRDTLKKQKNFLGGFTIIPPGGIKESQAANPDDVELENIRRIIEAAPPTKPERKDYLTPFAFMKAESAWKLAQRYKDQGPGNIPNTGDSNGKY